MSKDSREAATQRPTVLHFLFCSLTNMSRSTNPDMVTVFSLQGRMVNLKCYKEQPEGKKLFI